MLCPICNKENTTLRLYCSNCGSRLNTKRHTCGFLNEETDRFCGGCGLQLIDVEDGNRLKKEESNFLTMGSEKITEEDIKNILAECTEKISGRKATLSQDEIEKLFKE